MATCRVLLLTRWHDLEQVANTVTQCGVVVSDSKVSKRRQEATQGWIPRQDLHTDSRKETTAAVRFEVQLP